MLRLFMGRARVSRELAILLRTIHTFPDLHTSTGLPRPPPLNGHTLKEAYEAYPSFA